MNTCCGLTDKPTWALLSDLKQRGLLEETLIIWGGEFGRTPMFQGKGSASRDHHIKGFSMWMARGGINGGLTYSATDELGYNAVENVMHIRDLFNIGKRLYLAWHRVDGQTQHTIGLSYHDGGNGTLRTFHKSYLSFPPVADADAKGRIVLVWHTAAEWLRTARLTPPDPQSGD